MPLLTPTTIPGSVFTISTGSVSWVTPESIAKIVPVFSDFGSYASALLVGSVNPSQSTNYIGGTKFGFTVPPNSYINGVTMNSKVYTKNMNANRLDAVLTDVYLLYNGSRISRDMGPSGLFDSFDQAINVGGSNNTWGAILTPSIVNSDSFGFVCRAKGLSGGAGSVGLMTTGLQIAYTAQNNYVQQRDMSQLQSTTPGSTIWSLDAAGSIGGGLATAHVFTTAFGSMLPTAKSGIMFGSVVLNIPGSSITSGSNYGTKYASNGSMLFLVDSNSFNQINDKTSWYFDYYFGGSNDTWGYNLTPNDINNSFGVAIAFIGSSEKGYPSNTGVMLSQLLVSGSGNFSIPLNSTIDGVDVIIRCLGCARTDGTNYYGSALVDNVKMSVYYSDPYKGIVNGSIVKNVTSIEL